MAKYVTGKKAILKKLLKDGAGGPGTSVAEISKADAAALNPYKNAYYKRVKAANAFGRIAKLTGLGQ